MRLRSTTLIFTALLFSLLAVAGCEDERDGEPTTQEAAQAEGQPAAPGQGMMGRGQGRGMMMGGGDGDCPMKDDNGDCPMMGDDGGGMGQGGMMGRGPGGGMGHGGGGGMMGRGRGGGMGRGGMMGEDCQCHDCEMPGWMMSHDMPAGERPMQAMREIHALLANHESIERTVEEIAGGVRTVTTSDDPELTEAIRTHVRQMKTRYANDMPIRMMDPLFRELFEHRDAIEMTIEDVPGGVQVTEVSDDPKVTALIRQHAKVVSEFIERGMERAHEPSPLPEGYVEEPSSN